MLSLSVIGFFVAGGLAAGFLTGLLGIGGGAVMVPVLYQSFLHAGWDPRTAITTAIATSLSVMVFSSGRASLEYRRQGMIDWRYLRWVVAGSTVGTLLGAHVMLGAEERTIRIGFGILMELLALLTIWPVRERAAAHRGGGQASFSSHLAVGGVAGSLAAMFGVGGGAVMVPALVLITGMSIHRAIASSTAAIVFSALLSSADYAYQGWSSHSIGDGELGWIFLPAMATVGLASMVSVTYGARLAMRLPPMTLKLGLAALQAGIGVKVIFFD